MGSSRDENSAKVLPRRSDIEMESAALLGRDDVDLTQVPGVMLLEDEDCKLVDKIKEILGFHLNTPQDLLDLIDQLAILVF
jgi:hypothetical protein